MGIFAAFSGAAIAGAVLAFLAAVGLVSMQTGAPDANPAQNPVINYGDRAS